MSRTSVDIPTDDGVCPASVFRPDGAGPWPAVIFYMDGPGIRPILFEMGERLASHGYFVLLPDLFYRAGPYEPVDAKTLFSDPEKRAAHGRLFNSTGNVKAAADTRAFLRFLDAEDWPAPTTTAASRPSRRSVSSRRWRELVALFDDTLKGE